MLGLDFCGCIRKFCHLVWGSFHSVHDIVSLLCDRINALHGKLSFCLGFLVSLLLFLFFLSLSFSFSCGCSSFFLSLLLCLFSCLLQFSVLWTSGSCTSLESRSCLHASNWPGVWADWSSLLINRTVFVVCGGSYVWSSSLSGSRSGIRSIELASGASITGCGCSSSCIGCFLTSFSFFRFGGRLIDLFWLRVALCFSTSLSFFSESIQ